MIPAARLPASARPSTRGLLRARTAAAHARLEARLDVFSRLRSHEDYRTLLARFYGLYEPLEPRLAAIARSPDLSLDYAARRKVPLLERDLAALGLDAPALARLPRCTRLPALEGPAALLGCLYVLEGATLGGQLIARHVAQELGLGARGTAFFSSYGEGVGPMWRLFVAALEGFAADADRQAAVIRSANDTFAVFEDWLTRDASDPGGVAGPRGHGGAAP